MDPGLDSSCFHFLDSTTSEMKLIPLSASLLLLAVHGDAFILHHARGPGGASRNNYNQHWIPQTARLTHPDQDTNGLTSLQALFGASATAGTAAAASTVASLPGWQSIALACVLPTCLGYWKTEYGVSYAYGAATALTGALVLKNIVEGASSTLTVAGWHAASLVFYGLRLNLFLLYRELFVPKMKEMRDRIEERSKKRGSRLQRTPFVLGCAGLYFGLVSPVLVTAQLPTIVSSTRVLKAMQVLIATSWIGFIVAALGDLNKSVVKAVKGPDHLVTGGIFKFLRHPNYTGEVLGWTCSFLTALAAAIVVVDQNRKLELAGLLVSSLVGVVGIDFVLAAATNQLENKQKEKYEDSPEYEKWVKSSWSGFMLQRKKEEDSHTEPQLELVSDEEEEAGSGI